MSKNIDERVVEMRFDNDHFEKNVKETMSTLDKFKEKLNLTGAAKGLDNVSAAAKKVNIAPLATAAETVRLRFSALEVMAVTALQNITNSAINAGKRIVSSLTVEPVKTGFNEYELKMGSIQTIMAGTGEDLETVNKYLNELNEYSDKTIYSFADMTQNIGKFTNAGVKLEDAVLAIKGISNEAAVSGANTNEASRAMYNFAQALSSGYVKLIDWKSIELANMATVDFKNELIKTALALGTVTDAGDGMYRTLEGNTFNATSKFNDVLQDQWMTSEVLVQTLKKYSDESTDIGKKATEAATQVKTFSQMLDTLKESAQSGWAQTWELLVGDFDEAKELFTEISNVVGGVISKAADARNSLLKGALSSKWSSLEEKITGLGVNFDDFQEKLKETAREHNISIDKMIETEGSLEATMKHGWLTSDILSKTLGKYTDDIVVTMDATDALSKSLEEFGDVVNQVIVGNFGNGEERIRLLTEAGYDYATIQNLVNHVLGATTDELKDQTDAQLKSLGLTEDQVKALRSLAEESKNSGTEISDLLAQMQRPSGRELLIDTFRNALTGLGQVIGAVAKAWRNAFPPMTSEQLYGIIATIHKFSEKLVLTEEGVDQLKRTFSGLFAIIDVFVTLTGGVAKTALKILAKALGLIDMPILELTARVGDAATAFRDWLFENSIFAKAFDKVVESVAAGIKNVKAWFDEWRALPGTETKLEKFKGVFTTVIGTFNTLIQNGINKLKSLGKALATSAKKVKTWIDEFKEIPAVKKNLDKFKTGVTNVINAVKKTFNGCKQAITDFVDKIKSLDKLTIDDVIKLFKEFKNKIIAHFAKVGESFSSIDNALDGLAESAKNKLGETWKNFEDFLNRITGFGQSLKERIGKIDLGGIILAAFGVGTLTVGMKIGDALEALTAPVSGFGELLKNLAVQTKEVSGLMKAAKFTVLAGGFVALAAGILMLAGAIALLTLLDQKKLWSAVGAVAVMGVVLIGLAAAMAAINKGISNISVNTKAILALAGAILILVIALKVIEHIDPSKLLGSVTVLLTMMGSLLAVAMLLSKKTPQLFSGAASLMAFSAATLILVAALKSISNLDTGKAMTSLAVLLGIMGGLILITKMGKGIDKWGAVSALAAALALKVLVGVIEDFAKINLETVFSALLSLLPIIGMLAVIMYATKAAGQHAAKAGVAILAISASMIFMATAIKQLAKIEPESMAAPLAAMSVLMALMAGVIASTALAGQNAVKAGATLLMMTGALTVLAVVVAVLSKINPNGLWNAVGAIAALEACFMGLIVITKFATSFKSVKGVLITLTVAVGVLSLALYALANLNKNDVATATGALSAVMYVFAILLKVTSKLKGINAKTLATIGVLTLVVAGLAGIIYLLSDLKPESTIATAVGLSTLALTLSGIHIILTKSPKASAGGLVAMALLTAIILGLGGILLLLKDLKPESTIATAVGLSTMVLALSGACAILTVAGAAAGPALIGLGVLAAVIVGVGTLMAAIGTLIKEFPQINEWLDIAIPVLEKLGYGLGSFIGSIIGGFSAGVVSGLPEIADMLSAFMVKMEPFLESVKNITPDMIASAKNLVEIILLITAANLVNQIASFLLGSSNMDYFTEQLTALGEGIVAFSSVVKDNVDATSVETAANAGKLLTELASTIPKTGGLVQFIMGEQDIAGFGNQLATLARGIVDFSSIVKDNVDKDAVETAKNAGLMLTELASTIPKTGGLVQFIMGEQDIAGFGSQLGTLAKGIVKFSSIVEGNVDKDAVETAKNAGLMLTELADTVPNTGGLLSFIVGDNNISSFAVRLPILADGIVAFSTIVKGNVDKDAVETAKNAGLMLTELAATVPNTGGLLSFIVGGNDIDRFAVRLPILADGIVAFSTIVKGNVDKDAVSTAKDAGMLLVELSNSIPNTGGLLNFITGNDDKIQLFASNLPILADGIVAFSTIVKGNVDKDGVETAKNAGMLLADLGAYVNQSKTGGLLSFLVGGNMAIFGSQLPLLAAGIVAFSKQVSGNIDATAVTAATQAGELIATLSTRVTESTGDWLYNLFGGNNNKFKNFKTQMPMLGEAIVEFSKSISGKIDSGAVTAAQRVGDILSVLMGSMNATDISKMSSFNTSLSQLGESVNTFHRYLTNLHLATLREAMPVLSDVVDDINGWVASANTIKMSSFGTALLNVGKKVYDFYDEFVGIDLNKFKAALSVVEKLINQTLDMTTVDTTSVNKFAESLYNLGNSGVNKFVAAFGDSKERIKQTAKDMLTNFSGGIKDNVSILTTEIGNLITVALQTIAGKYTNFKIAGLAVLNQFSSGISGESSITQVNNAVNTIVKSAVDKLKSTANYNKFKSAGEYLAKGFAAGIESKTSKDKVTVAAKVLGGAAIGGLNTRLEINSPSRVAYASGEFTGMGLVNGLMDYANKAYDAGANIADSAKTGLQKAISKVVDMFNGDLDAEPTIRPVLDLTNVESGARRINTLFARNQVMSINVGGHNKLAEDQNGEETKKTGNVYNYTQNNYSPKALSRIDIYRQTKNQFSAMERMVEG